MENCSPHQLRDKQLQPSTPFWLEFTLDGAAAERWQCVNILRHFPGKRVVLQLRRDDSQMLCKLFFDERDYQRELRGHSYLKAAGITTPAIQRHGAFADGSYIIDYQFIEGQSLEQHNRQQALTPTSAILRCAVATLADMHRHGLLQTDIHLGNFLYYQGIVYVVDTAAIRRGRAPLPEKQAIANFADFPGQFTPGQLDDLQPLIAVYQQHNPGTLLQPDALAVAIAKKRDLRWRHYRGKLTRNCTEFSCLQYFRRFSVWRRDQDSPALDQVLRDPDQSMDGGIYLKRGNTATVARAEINDQTRVIKRYNIKDWRHQLSRFWRPTRGWRSWHNAHYLLFNGLQTPQPIALIEERFGPLRGRAFFICDYVAGTDLKTVLQTADPEQRQQLTEDFAGIVLRYYQAGISHGDMKADNFIVTPEGIIIIDLDPMQHHRRKPALEAALKKDIRRFLENFSGEQGQAIADELLGQLPEALQS